MEAVTPNPVCGKEALDLLNCVASSQFDREQCLRFLDALRSCVLEKKVKKFLLPEQKQADGGPNVKQNSQQVQDPASQAKPIPSPSPSLHGFNQLIMASSDTKIAFPERAFAAASATFLSAILSAVLTNPLDVAKTRLQAQAAGVPYHHSQQYHQLGKHSLSPGFKKYNGTLDVFFKVVREEGFVRLWRGTNASLALAVPTVGIYLPCYDIFRNWVEEFTNRNYRNLTPYAPLVAGSVARSLACIACSPIELARTRMQAFKEFRMGGKLPGISTTLLGVLSPLRSKNKVLNWKEYLILWTGVGAQLARDVPFSAICWSTLEPVRLFHGFSSVKAYNCPIRRRLLRLVDEESNAVTILGANFSAGFVAGTLAAAVTCPLDVAKTRRQIEKDPGKALNTTTRQTIAEVWRSEGVKGLFTGLGPRVARAGPSVGIVVSFYEVVKYVLHQRHENL
ncbi:putative cysteine alpha-hairpin motif superfamily, mitochondrial carrier domain superfamily [Dioscorea sansibarensis]